MALKSIKAEDVKEEGLHLIYGKPGTGKTSLANYLAQDGKTAVVTFDKSHAVLLNGIQAGAIDVFELDFSTDFHPDHYQETLNSLETALQAYKYVLLDNVSALETGLTADHKRNMGLADGRKAYGEFQAEMFTLCQLLIELDAICIVTMWEAEVPGAFGIMQAVPQANNKVSGVFAGFAQSVMRMMPKNGEFIINADNMATDWYAKNRKNQVKEFPSNQIVKFLATN